MDVMTIDDRGLSKKPKSSKPSDSTKEHHRIV